MGTNALAVGAKKGGSRVCLGQNGVMMVLAMLAGGELKQSLVDGDDAIVGANSKRHGGRLRQRGGCGRHPHGRNGEGGRGS